MDYEKKYNEALEHARAEILANPGLRKTWEEIFPELRESESEDERIRKIITDSVFYQYGAGVEYNDVLDYLDKLEKHSLQQEQQEKKEVKFVFPKFLYARTTNNKTIDVSYAPQNLDAVEYIRSDSLQQEQPEEPIPAYLEKQEQKPTVDVEPCDASWDAYYQRGLNKGYELGLDAGRKEQKPAWSEEDEHRRKDAIYFLESAMRHYADTSEIEKTIAWLKSLHPSWKPSEEQMEAFRIYLYNPQYIDNSEDEKIKLVESLYNDLKKLM